MTRSLLIVLVAVLASGRLFAAHSSSELPQSATDFVIANVLFTLTHELGHTVIDEFDIPILGNEEQAADTLATFGVLFTAETRQHDELIARLFAAADGWRLEWELGRLNESTIPYIDDHPLEIQRFYRIICLVYGSDPNRYETLAEAMRNSNLWSCEDEYRKRRDAVDWVTHTFGRRESDDKPAASTIRVTYESPATEKRRKVLTAVRASRIVERATAAIAERFRLPRPIVVAFVNCAGPNAYWSEERAEIAMCYGLFDHYAQLARLRDCLAKDGRSAQTQKCIRERLDSGAVVLH